MTLAFEITPPAAATRARIQAYAWLGEQRIGSGNAVVAYPHIHPRAIFPPSAAEAVRADNAHAGPAGRVRDGRGRTKCRRRYGNSAARLTLLGADDLATGDLARFDAIVTGVRAYNVRAGPARQPVPAAGVCREWRHAGGAVQRARLRHGSAALDKIGPYPIKIGRDRRYGRGVAGEFPRSPRAHFCGRPTGSPRRISTAGCRSAGCTSPRNGTPSTARCLNRTIRAKRRNQAARCNVPYGKGAYVFTAYFVVPAASAGVPGAFRVFANLLSGARPGDEPAGAGPANAR